MPYQVEHLSPLGDSSDLSGASLPPQMHGMTSPSLARGVQIQTAKDQLGKLAMRTPEGVQVFRDQIEEVLAELKKDHDELVKRTEKLAPEEFADIKEDINEWVGRVDELKVLVASARKNDIIDETCGKQWERKLSGIRRQLAKVDVLEQPDGYMVQGLKLVVSYRQAIEGIGETLQEAATTALVARDSMLRNIAHGNVERLEAVTAALKAKHQSDNCQETLAMIGAFAREFAGLVQGMYGVYGDDVCSHVGAQLLEGFSLPQTRELLEFLGAGLPTSKFKEMAHSTPDFILVQQHLGNLLINTYLVDGELAASIVNELWDARGEEAQTHVSDLRYELSTMLGAGNEGLLIRQQPRVLIDSELMERARYRYAALHCNVGGSFAQSFFAANPASLIEEDEQTFEEMAALLSSILGRRAELAAGNAAGLPEFSALHTTDLQALQQILGELEQQQ